MQIGFIGLGTMGASMAANLQKAGHNLIVHDVRKDAAVQHLAAGAVWADTPRAVAAAAGVIFTSLPGPREVDEVALGGEGLIEGIARDAAYFDLTTNARATVLKVHQAFARKGAFVLDAPVSGGPRGALTGKLAIWVGGERAAFDRHKVVLGAIGDQPRYIGPIGQATVAKLVHNCTVYAINTALAEAFTMGASMAANLQKAGHKLIVHDVRKDAAGKHLAAGATWADTPRDVASGASVIFTSLPGPRAMPHISTSRPTRAQPCSRSTKRSPMRPAPPCLTRR